MRSIQPDPDRQVDYPVAGAAGLALRVSPKGRKQWTLRYRTNEGSQRRLSIGVYPTLTLADAKTAARRRLGEVAGGADPAQERRAEKAEAKARKVTTVGELIEVYLDEASKGRHRPNARPKRQSTIDLERYIFEHTVRPRFGKMPLGDLGRAEVQRFLNEVGENSPSRAHQCRSILRQVFNYAIREEMVEKNPAALVGLPAVKPRERVLTNDEVRTIWRAASDPGAVHGLHLSPAMGVAIRFALVTLQRGGEVVGVHARELDLNSRIWTIPGDRTKSHRTQVLPLSQLAVDLLEQAFELAGGSSGYAFPSPRSTSKPVTRRAFTGALKRLTRASEIEDATPHDFRRTGSTNITSERIGISRFVVSRLLNHLDGGGAAAVTAVYDRHDYVAEKRKALDAWAALLAEMVEGKPRAPNVVPIAVG